MNKWGTSFILHNETVNFRLLSCHPELQLRNSLRRSILALHAVAAERYSDEKPHEKHEKSLM